MKVKIIKVPMDDQEFNTPKGYEPFYVVRNAHEWVVFCRPAGA